ncbi:ABC transporter ATP-binding protein [Longispora albida]|uniref:ABC transporter ATP-binding protein n=1 Tax=Longispora albida TaxID=203523 RepID=UPI00037CBB94|nr:ATP-binding cassette domain-containing protein [Longispora albida]
MQFDDVWLRYSPGEPWVLGGVTATFGPGEVIVVCGRNGEGKSTMLQAAAGLLRPARGRITDRPAVIGWVPDQLPAGQPFTVGEYLTHMGRVRGLRSVPVVAWAERLHLTQFLGVRLTALSKGTARKVCLVQGLLAPPDLLILDEPWDGLDTQAREEIPAIIAEVAERGGTVLVSDHRGEAVRLPGARGLLIEGGGARFFALPGAGGRSVVEVTVAEERLPETMALLRAAGHHDIQVRAR